MKPDSLRARRRHARWRMVERARRLFSHWFSAPDSPERWADNMKRCSCWMCGHKRRLEGPTVRERRAALGAEVES